jgi:phosphoribosylanthranilate isomerase
MPHLKICGLTSLADLGLALRLNADFLGTIVDVPRSPRSVSPAVASALLRAARGRGVVVTVRPDAPWLSAVLAAGAPAAVQFHAEPAPDALTYLRAQLPAGVELWAVLSLPVEPAAAADALPALDRKSTRLNSSHT